jgi:hypothetical protein
VLSGPCSSHGVMNMCERGGGALVGSASHSYFCLMGSRESGSMKTAHEMVPSTYWTYYYRVRLLTEEEIHFLIKYSTGTLLSSNEKSVSVYTYMSYFCQENKSLRYSNARISPYLSKLEEDLGRDQNSYYVTKYWD